MTVRCIDCRRFTLQPRPTQEGNEYLRERDREMAAIGWGRCAFAAGLSMLWYPSQTDRTCDLFKPLADDLVEARRTWLAAQAALK